MMKKLMTFLAVAVLAVMAVSVVSADSQVVDGTVPGLVNFTLATTSLSYGSVNPGSDSEVKSTTVTVNANNNVDFSIDVTLTQDDVSGIFQNIYLEDVVTLDTYTDQLLLGIPITRNVVDSNAGTPFDFIIKSVLKVPIDFSPVSGATGTVMYTITPPAPEPAP